MLLSPEIRRIAAIAVAVSGGTLVFAAGTPTKLVSESGNSQTALVGTTLPNAFVALVEDSNGNPVSGIQIDWAVTAGGGSFPAGSTFSSSSGLASNTLTLGTVAGSNKASAVIHINGGASNFGAVGSSGSAVSIGLYSGNSQTGTVGAALPNAMEVMVLDQYGNAANHTQVNWTVGSGGGSVPYPASTSSGGIATKVLTLGTLPGQNTATATMGGTNLSYTFTEQAVAGPVASVQIEGGNDQTGAASGALSSPLVVAAEDVYGNVLPGVQINWTASVSGDSFSPVSSVTDSSGLASSTLTLGSAFGTHAATVMPQGTTISQTFIATEGANAIAVVQKTQTVNVQAFQPYFLGLSYTKASIAAPLFNATDSAFVTLFENLGPGVLRLNADGSANETVWNHNGPGEQYGTVSMADMQRLETFLQAVNWKVLYGIALIDNNASCASGQTNCAADEAATATQVFGSNLLGFEIGNEPDIYANPVYGNPPTPQIPGYTWADYISTTPVYNSSGALLPSWPIFASAILAADPSAPLTGPTAGMDWEIPFTQSSVASETSLLTRHYYASSSGASPTMTDLLTPDPRVPTQFPQMAQAAAAANIPGGFRISECNSVAGYTAGVSDAFGAALWTIDFLFENAFYQSTGVNFNGGGDPTGSYSPILDNGVNVTGVGPDYYGLLAYSQLVKGGTLRSVQVTPSPTTLSAYAVQEPNGTTDLILSNKDPVNPISVGVQRHGGVTDATSFLLTAPSLTSTSGIEFGGSAVSTSSGTWTAASNPSWPIVDSSAVVTIPAGSAQVVHLR